MNKHRRAGWTPRRWARYRRLKSATWCHSSVTITRSGNRVNVSRCLRTAHVSGPCRGIAFLEGPEAGKAIIEWEGPRTFAARLRMVMGL